MAYEGLEGSHAVVLGGAGFLGSHLCTHLRQAGARVTVLDNLITGRPDNLDHLLGDPHFRLVHHDVTEFIHIAGHVDFVINFASPASPIDYLKWPIHTLKVGAMGTHKGLGLALAKNATFFLASTSEVYGDPLVNPQPETYWGNVNPIGPRGVYDEAKRYAEALSLAYHRQHNLAVRIVRIFNSILADEQVLYDDGNELRREPIGRLSERLGAESCDLDGYTVPAFAHDGSVSFRPAVALVGHPTEKRCFRVSLRYGRSIGVTEDHSLFVRGDDGKPEARSTADLVVGDRVAIARRIEVPERERLIVNMAEMWARTDGDPWRLDVLHPSFGDLAWRRRQEIFDIVAAEQPPTAQRFRSAVWSRVRGMAERSRLPLRVLQRLGAEVPADATVRLHTAGRAAELPLNVAISNELLWLLGLIVAEGTVFEKGKNSFVSISCGDELLDRAGKIVERDLGLHVVRAEGSAKRSAAIFLHSKLLVRLIRHLGFAGVKRIPGWVLGLPKSRLGWFLEGYREGDGVHSGKKLAEARRHEFSTLSEELKDDLVVALARFGLLPSVGRYETTFKQRTGDRRYPFWRITLSHVSPWSPLEWHRGVTQHLKAETYGDLVWAHVRAIEEVASTDLVYDFSVPGYENFWAGTGVMAHNTFGPRMRPNDGRAIPAFISAALQNRPLPIHGDGSQTRSLCYVDDLIEGILRLLLTDYNQPVNLGNPEEVTMLELARVVQEVVGAFPGIEFHPRPVDDPNVRRPDTTVAEELLGWKAQISLREGIERTVPWFRQVLGIR